MNTQILAPAAVLIVWSIVMLVWMALTRFPAMAKMGKSGESRGAGLSKAKAGARGQDLEGRIPDEVNWKAHNYTHLMEQPTLFYAVVAILAIAGGSQDTVIAAWIYTALRIAHSLWQSLVNTLPVRFTLFLLSTLALAYLGVRALTLTL